MKRLFLAIHIVPNDKFLAVYMRLKQQLKSEKIRWVEAENLHITIKFFGETSIENIEAIKNLMHLFVSKVEPFNVTIKGTRIFGSRYKPRVIWFDASDNKRLTLLASELFKELDIAGFDTGRQNFVPHLSLGRLKYVQHKRSFQKAIDTLKDVFVQEYYVQKFTLFESLLLPSSAVYKIVEEFELKQTF